MNGTEQHVVKDGDMNGNYEDQLIREMTCGEDKWCSQCERTAEDCVCEEICDHFRETEPYTHEEAEQRREWLREAYLDQGHLHI